MSTFSRPTSNPPPDAAAAPEGATGQDALDKRSNPHRTSTCLTCGGRRPWTPARRNQVELEALVRGDKRIIDLPEAVVA